MEEFTGLFDRITRSQMVSDVPVGAFLSGGLDSAAVVRAMLRADQGPVHALTVGFKEQGFDERPGAKETAASLGVPLEQQELGLDAASLLANLSRHVEEPTADSSILPVYLLCKAARRRFTVAMAGDGADEILAGYETYRATAMAERYRMLPRFVRREVLARLVRRLPLRDRKYSWRQVATRFMYAAELGPGRDHCAWRIIFNDSLKRRLYAEAFRDQVADCDPIGQYAAHIAAVSPKRDRLTGLLNADTEFYLPNDMLIKVDRMSMANGLEVRVPFLDVAMVRYVADLPSEYKLHRGRERKHILRESLRDSLSPSAFKRPKSGFNIPVEKWMRDSLRDMLFDAVSTNRDEVGRYIDLRELELVAAEHRQRREDHGHALFTVLMFALWVDNAKRAWRPNGQTGFGIGIKEPGMLTSPPRAGS